MSETNDVLKFVTYKERLKNAEAEMVLMYYDYQDNSGSNDSDWFWRRFEDARNQYRAIKNEVPQDE
jgi:hypothetical protein